MQIGEFAKLCGTRVSLLRHYDKIGLLNPAFTDVVTGYRYYDSIQMETYRLIVTLKDAGFSLPETRRLLDLAEDDEDAAALFEAKRAALTEMLTALEKAEKLLKGTKIRMEELCFNENLDFPFVDDPVAVGKWAVLGHWRSRDEFYAGKKPDTEYYGEKIREIYFLPGGEKYWAYGWTKGKLLIDEYKNPHWETYEIEEIDGKTYMLLDHKSYEYLVSGKTELVVFLYDGLSQSTVCHAMEHELSAFYDITHGHGLAILTPRWLTYVLDEETAPRIKRFGVNVLGVDEALSLMDGAKEAIRALEEFFFNTLGLQPTLTDLGIDDRNFKAMARKACRNDVLHGFTDLTSEDVEKIFRMCL